jgi:hypothetical protein
VRQNTIGSVGNAITRALLDGPVGAAERATRRATQRAQPWVDRLARAGYLAKGAVFVLVGGMAMVAAAGLGGEVTDPSGVFLAVAHTPAGRMALAATALGLLAHATFRALLVVLGEPYAARGPVTRALRRIANAWSALAYTGLAVTAGAVAAGWQALVHPDKDAEARNWSAWLLDAPFGRPLLAGVAAGILAAAIFQIVRAVGPNQVRRRLRVEEMTARQCRMMVVLGRMAYLGRAMVLGGMGVFLAWAALNRSPRTARGPAGALQAIGTQPYGDLLLGLVAAGLLAFGLYSLFEARWRRLLE